ncbi:MAG: adenylate/guanylate cyclase domain-containing protein [Leptospiraceae bacterium]|nr:adenylate/guanylate cyclase domain-containing protein [Leptospiraceae bacterium]
MKTTKNKSNSFFSQNKLFDRIHTRFQEEFDYNFQIEILKSETQRAYLVLLLICLAFLIFLVKFFFLFNPEELQSIKTEQVQWKVFLILLLYSFYEFGITFLYKHFQRIQKPIPLFGRIMNTLLEISFPTLIVISLKNIYPAEYLLATPPTYLYFIFIILSTLRLDFFISFFTGIFASLHYFFLVWITIAPTVSDKIHYINSIYYQRAFIFLVSGLMAGFVGLQIKKRVLHSIKLLNQKNELRKIFGSHVSQEVVNEILESGKTLVSEYKYVCVMFLDIRNFTKFSEHRTPEEVFNYLNLLFEFMIESINQNRGIINKFLGDGFMAVFGAPITGGKTSKTEVFSL